MLPSHSYAFLNICVIAFVVCIWTDRISAEELARYRLVQASVLLSVFWTLVDLLAVGAGLWEFPEGYTLPFRIFGLPLEEYVLFFIHTALVLVLIKAIEGER